MKFQFIYSIKSELKRVKELFDEKSFFVGKTYPLYFPKGFSFENESLKGLENQIKKEIEYDRIEKIKTPFLRSWHEHEKALDAFFAEFPYEVFEAASIQFTKYGTGGSYETPNKIIINVQIEKEYLENVVHELIHCLIQESVIQKHEVGHFEKEGLVDMVIVKNKHLKSIFPKYWYQNGSVMPSQELLKKIGWEDAGFLNSGFSGG